MGLYDRDYMNQPRGSSSDGNAFSGASASLFGGSLVKLLIVINVAVFIIGAFVDRSFGIGTFYRMFELSPQALAEGKVWTLITYSFLHANLMHITLNMLGLYFVGRPLESWIGARKFLAIYLLGAIAGGLLWLPTALSSPEALVGASASVMAVFAAFCRFYPPVPITFLIFFVLPVSMKPMTMLKVAVAIEFFGLIYSLSGGEAHIAYAAHLGGVAAGLLSVSAMRAGGFNFLDKLRFPSFKGKSQNTDKGVSVYGYKVNITDPEKLRAEVDRILDKINKEGFSALTDDEREILRKAKAYFK